MDQTYQLKLALLRKAAIAADAVVRSHTLGTIPNATSEQMQTAKLYMTMAVPGFILALFDEIDRLSAELAEAQKDAERHRFGRELCINTELEESLDPHMGWMDGIDVPETAEEHDAMIDRGIQTAKDNGLWPIKPELVLTEDAQADRDAFNENFGDGNCSCHISPPCSSCTHPGNPNNQEEDSACWTVAP